MVHRPTFSHLPAAADGAAFAEEAAAARRARSDRYARTRRASLVAEFEGDLGIDHDARLRAIADQQRWVRIKTFIVWTIAVMFFSIALRMLWRLGALREAGAGLLIPF